MSNFSLIGFQDALIAKLIRLSRGGRKSSRTISMALGLARKQLKKVGFPHAQCDPVVEDAKDMAWLILDCEVANG